MRLNGKVVIITGATTGIGRATAKRFAFEGATLILVARTKQKLEELSTELQGLGARVVIKQVDVTVPEELDEMIRQIFLTFNRIDILINNAGVGLIAPIESSQENLIRHMFETNFFAPLRASRNVIPLMRSRGGGQIINISSILGLVSLPLLTAYSATKFALNALTDGLRTEVAEDGIDLISICPGRVNTPFQSNALQNKIKEKRWGGISADRVAKEILNACLKRKRLVIVPFYLRLVSPLSLMLPSLKEWILRQLWKRTTKARS